MRPHLQINDNDDNDNNDNNNHYNKNHMKSMSNRINPYKIL